MTIPNAYTSVFVEVCLCKMNSGAIYAIVPIVDDFHFPFSSTSSCFTAWLKTFEIPKSQILI